METVTPLQVLEKEIRISAPKAAVWKTLQDADHLRTWYAAFCDGSQAITDWQEGSKALFVDGTNSGIIARVVSNQPGSLLSLQYTGVIANGKEDYDSVDAQAVIGGREIYRLSENEGSTTLAVTCDMAASYFDWMADAWDKALVIIKDLAEGSRVAQPELVITRLLDAPKEAVFQAWTEADRLAQWWGPAGFALQIEKLELAPKGIFHYSIALPDGQKMWGRFIYRHIAAPERLIFVSSFSNEEGAITPAPFSVTWPQEILNIITLEVEGDKTLLTLRGCAINATPAAEQTFTDGFASIRRGFAGTFDQLEAYLQKTAALQPEEA